MTRLFALWLATLLASCAVVETEGRSDEARATLTQFLDDLAGSSDDRGWSRLSESMRQMHGPRADYVGFAEQEAGETALPDLTIRLTYEDDGFYAFELTSPVPIDPAYDEILFRTPPLGSAIACRTDDTTFEMAVIIAPFSEFNGVTGADCPVDS